MNHLYFLVLAIALLVGSMSVATAQDFQKGLAAYQVGYYATALQEWKKLARAGYACAQSKLGVMYDNGQGVLQDNVMAHIWYNIGAANGNKIGGTNRDKIVKKMTSPAIEKA